MNRSEAEELWGLLLDIADSIGIKHHQRPWLNKWVLLIDTCRSIGVDSSLCRYVYSYMVYDDYNWKLEFMINCGVPTDDQE
jgi:hypothetical protein